MTHCEKDKRGAPALAKALNFSSKTSVYLRNKNNSWTYDELKKCLSFWKITLEEFEEMKGVQIKKTTSVTLQELKTELIKLTDLITKYERQIELEQVT